MTEQWKCWRDASHTDIRITRFGWPQCACQAAPQYHERPDYVPPDLELGVYIPADGRATAIIAPRSGVVGLPAGGDWIDVYFEGWVNGAMQYAELDVRGQWEAGVQHAASRMITDYPTIACAMLPTVSLTRIGSYWPKSRMLRVENEVVEAWLETVDA